VKNIRISQYLYHESSSDRPVRSSIWLLPCAKRRQALSQRPADSARPRPVCAVGICPCWLWRVTHMYTPSLPSLFPFTLTHLDSRDRGGGSDGNLGASRRGGTTELCEWNAREHPSSSPPLTLLLVHSQSYGELVVEEERARPVSIAWPGIRLGRFRSLVAAGRSVRMVAECHVQTSPAFLGKKTRVTAYRGWLRPPRRCWWKEMNMCVSETYRRQWRKSSSALFNWYRWR
jgi:hypothetical protein